MIDGALPQAPPRGTRPRNRRELIIAAAAELFHRDGYEKVSVGDVASAVNVRPSALYRHFSGKPQLLAAVVLRELEPFREAAAAVDSGLDTVLPMLVQASLDHPRLGALWQREARSLPREERTEIRDELRLLGGHMTAALLTDRPSLDRADAELLSWCIWAVLHSVGHQSVELPKAEYATLLDSMLQAVVTYTPVAPAESDEQSAEEGFTPQARREKLLAVAVPLFAAQGYAGVSMEDIGARAGMAGPSVYHHYAAKQDILYAALVRGDEWLRYDMIRALSEARGPDDALHRLIDSHVDYAAANSALMDILVSEVRNLPQPQRLRITQSQQDYVGEWLHLLREICPDMPPMQARARVHATLTMINDVARTRHLRERPSALASVKQLGAIVLLGS